MTYKFQLDNEDLTPSIDSVLVEWLEKVYPERVPDVDMSDREVWQYAGMVKLVRRLRSKLNEQQENILEQQIT